MRIIISLLLILSFEVQASVDLSVFSKKISLPDSCLLKVEVSKLITIDCNGSQYHHITFSTLSEASDSAEEFFKIASDASDSRIQLVSYQKLQKEQYRYFITHVIMNGEDDYSYVVCDDIVCFNIDSPSKEFIDKVLRQLDVVPVWKS